MGEPVLALAPVPQEFLRFLKMNYRKESLVCRVIVQVFNRFSKQTLCPFFFQVVCQSINPIQVLQ